MDEVRFKPLFTVEFETTPQVVGDVPQGYFRRCGIISSGRFRGDKLNGHALPGGGDWLFRRNDGVIHLDVRAMLETDRQEVIYMTYTGRLQNSVEVEDRLARGETVPSNELYFRTAVQFETAAGRISWLNDIVAFGIGHRRPAGPVYDVYELL